MPIYQAIILGVIQGVTEFLPISSSGHLALIQQLLNINQPDVSIEIMLHLGTLVSIVIYFWQNIKNLNSAQVKHILIGTIPIVITGILINPFIESIFSSLIIISIGFFISGIFLVSTKFISSKSKNNQLNNKRSIFIGLTQALALIPGISRSGTTVYTGLHLHL